MVWIQNQLVLFIHRISKFEYGCLSDYQHVLFIGDRKYDNSMINEYSFSSINIANQIHQQQSACTEAEVEGERVQSEAEETAATPPSPQS